MDHLILSLFSAICPLLFGFSLLPFLTIFWVSFKKLIFHSISSMVLKSYFFALFVVVLLGLHHTSLSVSILIQYYAISHARTSEQQDSSLPFTLCASVARLSSYLFYPDVIFPSKVYIVTIFHFKELSLKEFKKIIFYLSTFNISSFCPVDPNFHLASFRFNLKNFLQHFIQYRSLSLHLSDIFILSPLFSFICLLY